MTKQRVDEALRAARVVAEKLVTKPEVPRALAAEIDDGFGNVWERCARGEACGLQVVRPGKAQCAHEDCGALRELTAIGQAHGDYDTNDDDGAIRALRLWREEQEPTGGMVTLALAVIDRQAAEIERLRREYVHDTKVASDA